MDAESEALKPMAFFAHDSSAACDMRFKKLLRREGMAGYGRLWRLYELLAATEGHALRVEDAEDVEILASELMLGGAEECAAFLETLREVGLAEVPGDGTVTASRITENSLYFGKKRAAGSAGGRKRVPRV